MLLSYTIEYCRSILSSCLFAQTPWFACKGTRVVGRPPSPSSTGAQLTGPLTFDRLQQLWSSRLVAFQGFHLCPLLETRWNKQIGWNEAMFCPSWTDIARYLLASYLAYPTYPFLQDSHTAALNRSKCWQSGQAARKIRFWDKSIPQIGSAMRSTNLKVWKDQHG